MDDKTLNPGPWTDAESPPEAKPGSWSRWVIGFTNLGNVFQVRYYSGNYDGPWWLPGAWQRPAFFMKGEAIKWWVDKPDAK